MYPVRWCSKCYPLMQLACVREKLALLLTVRPLQVVYWFLVHPFQEDAVFNSACRAVYTIGLHLSRFDSLPTMNFCGHITKRTNDTMKVQTLGALRLRGTAGRATGIRLLVVSTQSLVGRGESDMG